MQQEAKIVSILQRDQALQTNMPVPPTPLLGREQAIQDVLKLLRRPDIRLLTLTGTAGIGKTRLSLEVATRLAEDFSNGIFFIPLAPISDPSLVIPTIAKVFALKETGQQGVFDLFTMHLQDKQLLLVLDNFEQVIQAAPQIAELLAACPALKVIVTSREVLRIRHEQQFPIFPLALPDVKHLPDAESLAEYAAIALFVQRAQAIKPGFRLTSANAQAIAEICAHLDGLPLAIELAAARIKLLSPQALLARLDHRLQILTQGPRDLPERQQALRQTIQWSYDLLNAEEQWLFRCLSVFVGGCTLEAVEQVEATIGNGITDVLNGITSLIDKSLVQQKEQANGESRLMMLEMIREYGLEQLEANNEEEIIRGAHASYFLFIAEETERNSSHGTRWIDRLEQEHDNLRAALQWLIEREESEIALRLSVAIWKFWRIRGHLSEGRQWLEKILAMSSQKEMPYLHAKVLLAAGWLTALQDDHARAEVLLEEGLRLFRELAARSPEETMFKRGMADTLDVLGHVIRLGRSDYVAAHALQEESLRIARSIGDRAGMGAALFSLGLITTNWGDYAAARALYEESLALAREVEDAPGIALRLLYLADNFSYLGDYLSGQPLIEESLEIARTSGDAGGMAEALIFLADLLCNQRNQAAARPLAEEGLEIARKSGFLRMVTAGLSCLGRISLYQGDYQGAQAFYEEAVMVAKKRGYKLTIAKTLEGLAQVVAAQGQFAWAIHLWSAAEILREALRAPRSPARRATFEQVMATARTQLGEKTVAAIWAQGRLMTPDQALAAKEATPKVDEAGAAESLPASPTSRKSGLAITEDAAPTYPNGLTQREVEVLRLLTTGLSNTQIAEQLVISRRTVNAHLRSIYNKLDVTTRTAATRYAFDNHLV